MLPLPFDEAETDQPLQIKLKSLPRHCSSELTLHYNLIFIGVPFSETFTTIKLWNGVGEKKSTILQY